MSFAQKAYTYFTKLKLAHKLPAKVEVMNPYTDKKVRACFKAYLEAYYSDERPRVMLFGINPGRFGAGITGVAFTDPVALQDICNIPNAYEKKREASSTFIYEMIEAYGGVKKFTKDFFLTATCPLGFVKNGINYNFYDHPDLQKDVTPFIVANLKKHLKMGARKDVAIVLGTGKLAKYFNALNEEYGFFERVIALDHPRFIVQYRRKRMWEYIRKYCDVLTAATKKQA